MVVPKNEKQGNLTRHGRTKGGSIRQRCRHGKSTGRGLGKRSTNVTMIRGKTP